MRTWPSEPPVSSFDPSALRATPRTRSLPCSTELPEGRPVSLSPTATRLAQTPPANRLLSPLNETRQTDPACGIGLPTSLRVCTSHRYDRASPPARRYRPLGLK